MIDKTEHTIISVVEHILLHGDTLNFRFMTHNLDNEPTQQLAMTDFLALPDGDLKAVQKGILTVTQRDDPVYKLEKGVDGMHCSNLIMTDACKEIPLVKDACRFYDKAYDFFDTKEGKVELLEAQKHTRDNLQLFRITKVRMVGTGWAHDRFYKKKDTVSRTSFPQTPEEWDKIRDSIVLLRPSVVMNTESQIRGRESPKYILHQIKNMKDGAQGIIDSASASAGIRAGAVQLKEIINRRCHNFWDVNRMFIAYSLVDPDNRPMKWKPASSYARKKWQQRAQNENENGAGGGQKTRAASPGRGGQQRTQNENENGAGGGQKTRAACFLCYTPALQVGDTCDDFLLLAVQALDEAVFGVVANFLAYKDCDLIFDAGAVL
eukprot:gene2048-13682_t